MTDPAPRMDPREAARYAADPARLDALAGQDPAALLALARRAVGAVAALAPELEEVRRQLTFQRDTNHRRNVELDALHYVWCDGGCEGGTHRYAHRAPLDAETVEAAVRNTRRLVAWWNAHEFAPDPVRQGPAVAEALRARDAAREQARAARAESAGLHEALRAARAAIRPGQAAFLAIESLDPAFGEILRGPGHLGRNAFYDSARLGPMLAAWRAWLGWDASPAEAAEAVDPGPALADGGPPELAPAGVRRLLDPGGRGARKSLLRLVAEQVARRLRAEASLAAALARLAGDSEAHEGRLLARLRGREHGPTDAEVEAHFAADGAWLVWEWEPARGRDWMEMHRGPDAVRSARDYPGDRVQRWWAVGPSGFLVDPPAAPRAPGG